jgi:hypothetical protein
MPQTRLFVTSIALVILTAWAARRPVCIAPWMAEASGPISMQAAR